MTERIDHVAATQSLLQHAQGADPVAARVTLDAAQVHATLALVEQQRIANLIALADHARERFANYAGEAGGMGTLFSYPETEGGNFRIRDDIREGLGL